MDTLFDPTITFQITTHSPDEFQEKAVGWDIDHLQLVRGVYRSSLSIVHTPNMQLSRTVHNIGILERGSIIQGAATIALPVLSPDVDRPYFCGSRLNELECPVALAGAEYEILSSGVETYFCLVVAQDILDRKAILLTGQPFSSLVRSHRVCIQKQNQKKLVQIISTLMNALNSHEKSHLIRQQVYLEKQLVRLFVMSIIPPSGRENKLPPNRRQVARKAEVLIRQYPQQNLSIEQICRYVGCSARNLHLGFKECYGVTPRQYAHTVALNHVRKQLIHNYANKRISDIAMDYGFFHLGRFSQQYRQLFDERPRDTVECSKKRVE